MGCVDEISQVNGSGDPTIVLMTWASGSSAREAGQAARAGPARLESSSSIASTTLGLRGSRLL